MSCSITLGANGHLFQPQKIPKVVGACGSNACGIATARKELANPCQLWDVCGFLQTMRRMAHKQLGNRPPPKDPKSLAIPPLEISLSWGPQLNGYPAPASCPPLPSALLVAPPRAHPASCGAPATGRYRFLGVSINGGPCLPQKMMLSRVNMNKT